MTVYKRAFQKILPVTGIVIGLVLLGVTVALSDPNVGEGDRPDISTGIALQIEVVLSAPDTTFAFTLRNKSKEEITIGGAEVYPNKIIIIKPNGDTVEYFAYAGPPATGKNPVLKPNEFKTWRMNMSDLFTYKQLNAPGSYRVYWVREHFISKDNASLIKSNEILVLRGGDTPTLDPVTGAPIAK